MYAYRPFIYEGEIIAVQDVGPAATRLNVVRYLCRIEWEDGSEGLITNVVAGNMFGGIDDYSQSRLRSTEDSGDKYDPVPDDGLNAATVGTRVHIAFLGGNPNKPRIIGYEPHPGQTQELDDPSNLDPQSVFKLNGVRFDITDTGLFRVTHFGLPKIAQIDPSLALASPPAAPGGDLANPAVTPASTDGKTFFEFDDTGIWRVVNSAGNLISIDPVANRVYIANNDTPSIASDTTITGPSVSSNNTDSEYLLLDGKNQWTILNARKKLTIYSFGLSRWISEDDYTMHLLKNGKITIDGDLHEQVGGDYEQILKGDWKQTVSGDYTVASKGDVAFTGDGEIVIKSKKKATLHLADKISLGVGSTEVLATLSKALKALQDTLAAIGKLTVGTTGGPSSPPINAADFVKIQTDMKALQQQLDQITG